MLRYLCRFCLPFGFFALALLAGCIGHAPAGEGSAHGHDQAHPAEQEPSMMQKLLVHVLDGEDVHLFESLHFHINLREKFGGAPITKFMVLEVVAALLIVVIYVPLAWQVRNGEAPRGWFWNAFEVLLTFVREQVAKPSIGAAHADRYVPFLWTLFLFILFNNLLGMFPFLGSPTASIFVTGALALVVFFAIHGSAIAEMANAPAHGHGHDDNGHGHDHAHHEHAESRPSLVIGAKRYIQSFWPNIDLPTWPMGLPIKALIFVLEVQGSLIRNGVLAVRLFANMFAGHMVLATILLFIQMAANVVPGWMGEMLWGTVTVASVVGILLLSLLEIFVAFLQAYIFTYLAAIFMGMAMHPEH